MIQRPSCIPDIVTNKLLIADRVRRIAYPGGTTKGGIIFTGDNSFLAGEGFPPDLILLQDTGIVHLVTEKCLLTTPRWASSLLCLSGFTSVLVVSPWNGSELCLRDKLCPSTCVPISAVQFFTCLATVWIHPFGSLC